MIGVCTKAHILDDTYSLYGLLVAKFSPVPGSVVNVACGMGGVPLPQFILVCLFHSIVMSTMSRALNSALTPHLANQRNSLIE